MTKYAVILLTFLLIGCSEPANGQQNEEELRTGRKSEFVGYSGNFEIYKLAVEGGMIYEYHYHSKFSASVVKGFRIVFVPDNKQQQGRRP